MTCPSIGIHKSKRDTQMEFILCLHWMLLCRRHKSRRHPYQCLLEQWKLNFSIFENVICISNTLLGELWDHLGQWLHQLLRSPMLEHPAELRLLWSLSHHALESQTELRCSAVAAAKRQSLQVAVARFWMGGLCSGSRFIQRKALGHWSL